MITEAIVLPPVAYSFSLQDFGRNEIFRFFVFKILQRGVGGGRLLYCLSMIIKLSSLQVQFADFVTVSPAEAIFYNNYLRFKSLQTKLGKTSPNLMIPKNQGKEYSLVC